MAEAAADSVELTAITAFEAVASSDGTVDGTNSVKFITKSGITISAGTRLVLSRIGAGVSDAEIELIGINIKNTECTDPTVAQTVTIEAVSAKTDGGKGYDIQGGVSAAQDVIDISAQFNFYGAATTIGEVNAESTDWENTAVVARTQFVYDGASTSTNKLLFKSNQLITKVVFTNTNVELDQAIELDGADVLNSQFIATAEPGSTVKVAIYDTQDYLLGDLKDIIPVSLNAVMADIATSAVEATVYGTPLTALFTEGQSIQKRLRMATYNEVFYALENTDPNGVMNFNYDHTPTYQLDFANEGLLDHCVTSKLLHSVGVNGAVIKVPYTYDTANNWVRITNEHSELAEITMDIFDESGNQMYSVDVGTVGHHASVVLRANELIDLAIEDGYEGTGTRHTMTFTVTAPRDSVHGVSVQAIPGGVDRVLPVLDQNDWSQ